MSIPVLYDACVLYGNEVRDLTSNLNDFPAETLQPFGIEAKTPDDFVLDQISLDEAAFVTACTRSLAVARDLRGHMKRSSTLSSGPA